ncbi:MAG: hypothetical protein A2087_12005 [Spirochaetes bacterium GWD1_61_31]|nr:MAG: hypothetical protein A2Y37_11170 [Spirochaetes bacterium GWB1_60_80]OHD35337.1 MAG: hypothetical protein A2004_00405 [Spirochaetes bacterium GWC1_61_12]OHD43665.1 MAG: hypothetical protein A2087_12005 [Spirochaetes bacterium GWD1_61_31]OHD44993.1 MAG: hypothetical protein A2Y35_13215 [Spirochaetes bacterium GWE1_60_18]OHD60102.1 MAG: hypothetical protein A2Y32_11325 [Spirochaetes bacterium GWF1_60_12]HAP43672.1 ATP-binding protein [Spirochaetaceae bacterium]
MHFTICDFVLDLVQNSIEAHASHIQLVIEEAAGFISVGIDDNGQGMDQATQKRAQDPYFTDGVKHRRRKVGLGIPFLVQAVQQVGGDWNLHSEPGVGTKLYFRFPAEHLDTPPLGDLPGLLLSIMCFDGDYDIHVRRANPASDIDYQVNRLELRDALGGFGDANALLLARQFLESQEIASA